MMTKAVSPKASLAAIVDLFSARERAARAGDATTSLLLDAGLRATMERRRSAQAGRRVLARRSTPDT